MEPNYRLGWEPSLVRNEPEAKILSMAGGLPDTRLVSSSELSRAIRRALRRGSTLLDYGSPYGTMRLRQAIADMLRETRGMQTRPESVLITRGSQMGLYLLAQSLLREGDVVAVESIGYRAAFDAIRMHGARLAPVPIDERGMQVDHLEELHARRKLRAIYLTPHHQFPTLVTLSASRRIKLQAFARKHRIAVIEDDYDHEFHYEGRPVAPMASNNTSGNVIYLGTLSKVLAPGLRIGYVVAPPVLIKSLAAIRSHIDSHGDAVMETAIAEWIEEGDLERHARRVRKVYLARRHALINALDKHLGDTIQFDIPNGGMALWVRSVESGLREARSRRALSRRRSLGPDYEALVLGASKRWAASSVTAAQALLVT
ncbi:MAG: PLP-dependent aminotransferase family protein, partial [Myxococcales bacterium]|nr:PLP-dependent aminotransferase family protein [Myxococcales bacterium]